jgi:DNA uptake protein ComE-like DNA-binding protein
MATKAKHLADARASKGRDFSPKWDGHETWDTNQFLRHFHSSMAWYRLESSNKELKPKVIDWMGRIGCTKEDISAFKKTKDNRCGTTMGAIAACLIKGMPAVREDFNDGKDSSAWLRTEIARVISEGKDDKDDSDVVVEVKKDAYTPSIQERVRDASMLMTEEIETAIENFQTDPEAFDPKAFKILNVLKAKQAKAAHARIIREFYARDLEELQEVSTTKDEQLKEAYSHLSKVQLRKITAFYQEIVSACEMLAQEAKVNRKPKAKKAVPAEKIVAKLKYKKADEPLKLVSINPADILGAKELWTYNTKSRKLGKYIASEFADLGIKGTSIINFDENKSVQKTLRKPVDQLKEFKAAGKVALRKFLDDINAVDTKMNGRINEEIMLLKVQ